MLKIESEFEALSDGRTLKRKVLNGGYNIIPPLFKVAGYKNIKKLSQNITYKQRFHFSVKPRFAHLLFVMYAAKLRLSMYNYVSVIAMTRVKSGIFVQTAKFGQPPCLFLIQ